jgi:spore coat protein A
VNRRQFFKTSAGAAALLAARRRAYGFYQSPGLQKFIQPARTFTSTTALPLAVSDGTVTHGAVTATHYSINIGQFEDQLHPSLGPTKLWGYYQDGGVKRHLGGTILAQKDTPVQVTFKNLLPSTHIIPVDVSSFFPDAQALQNKTAVHLHGGLIPWISDGGPYSWFTPTAVGPSFKNNILKPSNPMGSAEYYWPNAQSARLLWCEIRHSHPVQRQPGAGHRRVTDAASGKAGPQAGGLVQGFSLPGGELEDGAAGGG